MNGTTSLHDLPTEPSIAGANMTGGNIVIEKVDTLSAQSPLKYDPSIPPPASQPIVPDPMVQMMSSVNEAASRGATNLPQRDIPRDTTYLTNDPKILPNYIPSDMGRNDYIRTYENNLDFARHESRMIKNKMDSLEIIYEEIQIPILLAVLYFLFELPVVRKWMYKYGAFLFHHDGNMNIYGILFKSLLFGVCFYFIYKVIHSFGKDESGHGIV